MMDDDRFMLLGREVRFVGWEDPNISGPVAILEDILNGDRHRVTTHVLRELPRVMYVPGGARRIIHPR